MPTLYSWSRDARQAKPKLQPWVCHVSGELRTYETIISACRTTGVRAFFVGGAGSLFQTEGGPLQVESPHLPDDIKPEARQHIYALEYLKGVDDVSWTSLAPAPMI